MNEEVTRWLDQLKSPDYGRQLVAVGRLVELGDEAVPQLVVALRGALPYCRGHLATALAGIGSKNPEGVAVLVALWEANLGDWFLNQALYNLAKKLAREVTPESIPALIRLLGCFRHTHYNEGGNLRPTFGVEAAVCAAEALNKLAYRQPTRQLREALPALKRSFWSTVPPEFGVARRAIEDATTQWKDLPLVVDASDTDASLPLPSHGQGDPRD